jgi:hypothetical protein
MEKAWEKACDDILDRENLAKVPGGYKEARQDYDDMMARQVHNSPPPLDDVGGGAHEMLDEKDPTSILLNARGKTHGDFAVHANITQSLKDVMRIMSGWNQLTDCQKESLEMIAHKIGRILAGDPNFADHWVDLAGYSELGYRDIISRQE